MLIFDKLTARQLVVFSEILAESSLMQEEFIREKYSRSALNFDETREFFKGLGLIDVQGRQVSPNEGYKTLLKSLATSGKKDQILKSFIGQVVIQNTSMFSDDIREFIKSFKFENNQYEFKPVNAVERLKFSGLRNFLMDLEVIRLEPDTMKYVMNDSYYVSLGESIRKPGLTPEEFVEIERRNREIGLKAELQIIQYEKERLYAFPGLTGKIEHMAKQDISLGYDIKSYEGEGDQPEGVRLIEVKAVSIWNYEFHWTRSEIEASRINGNGYYLYLLPVITKSEFDLESLKIIKDPYKSVLDSEQWSKCVEVMSLRTVSA